MKRLLSLTVLLLLAATGLFAQGKKERQSPHETITGKNMKITYGRPYKKGREVFGKLVPYGQVWRTGADEATEITLDKDCLFGGKQLKAGTYSLFTIPGQTEWHIILNPELKQWGAFGYDKIKDKDALNTTVSAKALNKEVEEFTIVAEKDGIKMEWDKTSVFVPVKFFGE